MFRVTYFVDTLLHFDVIFDSARGKLTIFLID